MNPGKVSTLDTLRKSNACKGLAVDIREKLRGTPGLWSGVSA